MNRPATSAIIGGMGDEVLIAWMRLARLPGVGPVLARRLLAAFGGPAAILDASPAALAAVEGIGTKTASLIRAGAAATRVEAQRELDRARHHGIGVLALEDPGYPAALRTIHDPPLVLYVRGEMQRGIRRRSAWWGRGNARCTGARWRVALVGRWRRQG